MPAHPPPPTSSRTAPRMRTRRNPRARLQLHPPPDCIWLVGAPLATSDRSIAKPARGAAGVVGPKPEAPCIR
eukprot:gene20520-biopygen22123